MDLQAILDFNIGTITVEKIFNTVLLFVVLYIIARILLKMIGRLMARLKMERTLELFAMAVCRVGIYILVALIVIDYIGVPITSLVAVLSVAGVALSLALQNTLSNLISGVQLLITKPFAVDHYVEAGGVGGTVKEIGLIYTRVATPDNKVIYIPNSDISSSRIINYSAEEFRRIDLTYSASYDDGLEKVKEALFQAIDAIPEILRQEDKAPLVAVNKYGDSAIDYVVRVWVKNSDYWAVTYALNEAVKASFDRNQVEMTYPHLNVHMVK
ncbi:MAG TPA: mechanosensitive ion channel family protein [Candidatus Anaerofilum excrementigallinarum]|nr:mechanosensitive ion channel family protein [Candidatus Anaerofilum excrementigallinarum]